MKKCLMILLGFLIMLSIASESKAMNYMLGAKAGYYSWQPYYRDLGGSGMSDIDWGNGVLYGPIASLLFTPDISFSVAGLMGTQSTHWQSLLSDFSDPNLKISGNYYFEVFRADIDSALSYRLSDNFRIFAGYKYQYLEVTYSYTEIRTHTSDNLTEEILIGKMDDNKNRLHGPAIGFGFSLPFAGKYFFAANISGIYMQGKIEFNGSSYSANTGSYILTSRPGEDISSNMRQYGINIEPAIGIAPGDGLPIITLGLRYQRLRVKFTSDIEEMPTDWMDDTLIGVFVSAVYVF